MGDWENTGRAFATIFILATVSAVIAAFLIGGAAIMFQDPGTPLISSDKYFLLYIVPLIFFASLISVMVYKYAAQEKIQWLY